MIREHIAYCVACEAIGCAETGPLVFRRENAEAAAFVRGFRRVDGQWRCPPHSGLPPGSFTARDVHDAFGDTLTDAQRELAELKP